MFKTVGKILTTSALSLAALTMFSAPHLAEAADAKLVFARASVTRNAWGNFPGIPGGSSYGNNDACQALGGASGLKLIPDIARRNQESKARLTRLFANDYMKAVMDRVVYARKLSNPSISEEDARTIHVVIHDCTFDGMGVGPAVLPLKGTMAGPHYEGKNLPWILLLSNASFGKIEQLVGDDGLASRIADDVIAHELTHGITADLLTEASIKKSNEQKVSKAHHAEILSDVAVAFWEGWAEGVEASLGATVRGALHPFSLGGLGKYVFVFERQQAVRDNLYVYDNALFEDPSAPRTHRSGAELLTAEGFMATVTYRVMNELPYRLPNGRISKGWPFQALSKRIHDAQPTNTVELVQALASDPNGGASFAEDFLKISSGVTASSETQSIANLLILLKDHLAQQEENLRQNPGSAAIAAEIDETKQTLTTTQALLETKIQELQAQVRAGQLSLLKAVGY